MKFLSLFSGIGGMDLGLERAGMECIGQVEYNPFCQRVLKHHWPHVKLVGDIHDVTGSDFGAVELICGGFPCQPFSNAGKRKGTADDRYLWPEMLRVIKAYRPAWVLGENVAGIVNMELDNVLSDLEREGYETQAFIIPACAVDAKHERKRVWIVAHSTGERSWCKSGDVIHKKWDACTNRGTGIPPTTGRQDGVTIGNDRSTGENVPDSNSSGLGERRRAESIQPELDTAERAGQDVADRANPRAKTLRKGENIPAHWLPESGVLRVAHGVPGRVDRLRSLGNAVVPQVVEVIGKAIIAAEILFQKKDPPCPT